MTGPPTPTVVHPDRAICGHVLRDAPVSDFLAMVERSDADPEVVDTILDDW